MNHHQIQKQIAIGNLQLAAAELELAAKCLSLHLDEECIKYIVAADAHRNEAHNYFSTNSYGT